MPWITRLIDKKFDGSVPEETGISWSYQYEANELPTAATPAWTVGGGSFDTAEISPAGYLHIAQTGSNWGSYITENSFVSANGFTIEFKLTVTSLTAGSYIEIGAWSADDGSSVFADVYSAYVELYGDNADDTYEIDPSGSHVYRITKQGTAIKLYVDDSLVLDLTDEVVGSEDSNLMMYFGSEQNVSLDYLYWKTDGAVSP